MANRKQFLPAKAADGELLKLLERSKGQEVSEKDLQEQRISFAYGNAMNTDAITKDSVRNAASSLRLRA